MHETENGSSVLKQALANRLINLDENMTVAYEFLEKCYYVDLCAHNLRLNCFFLFAQSSLIDVIKYNLLAWRWEERQYFIAIIILAYSPPPFPLPRKTFQNRAQSQILGLTFLRTKVLPKSSLNTGSHKYFSLRGVWGWREMSNKM